jgi:hypothetical protein
MTQILPALNFGEISALESAENAEFFHVITNFPIGILPVF